MPKKNMCAKPVLAQPAFSPLHLLYASFFFYDLFSAAKHSSMSLWVALKTAPSMSLSSKTQSSEILPDGVKQVTFWPSTSMSTLGGGATLALFFLDFHCSHRHHLQDQQRHLFIISNRILHLRLQLLKSWTASQAGVARFLVSFQGLATH